MLYRYIAVLSPQPEVRLISPSHKLRVGDPAVLICTLRADLPGPHQFSWFGPKNETLISSIPDYIVYHRTLVISNLTYDDTGRYTCRVTTPVGQFSAFAMISVLPAIPCEFDPPIIALKPKNVTVYLNTTGLIEAAHCTNYSSLLKINLLTKTANTAVKRYRTDQRFAEQLNAIQVLDTLNIINASVLFDSKVLESLSKLQQIVNNSNLLTLDFNISTTSLVNTVDLPSQSAINRSAALANAINILSVSHPREVFMPAPAQCPQHEEVFNNTVFLPCDTESRPQTITFYHNGIPIDRSDTRFQYYRYGLQIRNISPVLAGKYTCVAVNGCASSSVPSFVNVTGKLDIDLMHLTASYVICIFLIQYFFHLPLLLLSLIVTLLRPCYMVNIQLFIY